MEADELRKILSELYTFEPSLREKEPILIPLINKLGSLKPDTKFDAAFAARLKKEIIGIESPMNNENNKSIINFNFMDRKLYFALGSLAVASIAFIFFMKTTTTNPQTTFYVNKTGDSSQEAVSVLPAGAFGNLASLGSSITNGAVGRTATLGMGGGGNIASPEMATFAADASNSAVSSPMAGSTIDMKIMPPYYGFKYVYKGETLNLEEASAAVYRRIKGDDGTAKSVAGLISNLDLAGFNLSSFNNLKATNISLMEDKELGLAISFDFNEGNINIYENWEKWTYPERDACGNDQACWDRNRLKISDVPADADLISLADSFITKHAISLDHYGTAIVDNYWRDNYAQSSDKANFYIPEYATVIYPLLIDDQAVRDQSGNYAGLRVNLNLNKKAASGLTGLMPYRYESSQYNLESSADAVIKLAETGGWNGNYYFQGENFQTIELGTPEKAYVQIYRYTNNRNEELLVPALIFPVINVPEGVNYYGQRYVTVPLVKEMLNDLGAQPGILYRTMEGGGSASGSAGASSGGIEVTPVNEPAIDLVAPTPPSRPVETMTR